MIEILTGLPGMGKTCVMAKWGFIAMREGKTVYSNFPLKGAIPFQNPLEVLGRVKNSLILIDECGLLFDQLKMFDMPYEIFYELRQHRKDGVDLLTSAQSIFDVAYPFRRLIQFENRIKLRMWRFAQVVVRDPQPSGEEYGKRLWFLADWVFKIYRTEFKVKPPAYLGIGSGEEDYFSLSSYKPDLLSEKEDRFLRDLLNNVRPDMRVA